MFILFLMGGGGDCQCAEIKCKTNFNKATQLRQHNEPYSVKGQFSGS